MAGLCCFSCSPGLSLHTLHPSLSGSFGPGGGVYLPPWDSLEMGSSKRPQSGSHTLLQQEPASVGFFPESPSGLCGPRGANRSQPVASWVSPPEIPGSQGLNTRHMSQYVL